MLKARWNFNDLSQGSPAIFKLEPVSESCVTNWVKNVPGTMQWFVHNQDAYNNFAILMHQEYGTAFCRVKSSDIIFVFHVSNNVRKLARTSVGERESCDKEKSIPEVSYCSLEECLESTELEILIFTRE